MNQNELNWDILFVNSSIKEEKSSREYYEEYLDRKELINKISLSDLRKIGLLTKDNGLDILEFLLAFNQNNSLLYRKAETANEALSAIWVAKVTTRAKVIILNEKVINFSGIDKSILKEIAKLSQDLNSIPKLPSILRELGIVLIYEKYFPTMKLDGVVQKLDNGTPVIGMSLRYSRVDYFWFTLMHELAHIVLHYDKLDTPIVEELETDDGLEKLSDNKIEKQANRLAKESFVERSRWRSAPPKYSNTDKVLREFAKSVNIHPAIIAGLIRHEQNNYTKYSRIINADNVRELIFKND